MLQFNDSGPREILVKAQDIVHLGPAPPINGLIIIPHTAQIPVPLGQQAQPQILGYVGVLILIHQNIAELLLVMAQHLRKIPKQHQTQQNHIPKIQRIQALHAGLIILIKAQSAAAQLFFMLTNGDIGGQPAPIFPALNHAADDAGGTGFFVQPVIFQKALDNPQLVIGIQNGEIFRIAQFVNVLAQNAGAQSMKSPQPQPPHGIPHHGMNAVAHFGGGLVGKGHGQNAGGKHPIILNQMRQACG